MCLLMMENWGGNIQTGGWHHPSISSVILLPFYLNFFIAFLLSFILFVVVILVFCSVCLGGFPLCLVSLGVTYSPCRWCSSMACMSVLYLSSYSSFNSFLTLLPVCTHHLRYTYWLPLPVLLTLLGRHSCVCTIMRGSGMWQCGWSVGRWDILPSALLPDAYHIPLQGEEILWWRNAIQATYIPLFGWMLLCCTSPIPFGGQTVYALSYSVIMLQVVPAIYSCCWLMMTVSVPMC